ncbi:hypothetical protein F7R14_16690 [Pseudomonas lini]|uniref:Uncharacterized protein n=1 Tax=Pseudomonas lini TaxID=163011 RepID=A0A7V7P303_9PSED|nr:hypothetical protein F7R14_16690 [Pseudomonas lini]
MPAKAECQPISMLNVLASSRASPLPQGFGLSAVFVGSGNKTVGAGLLAKAVCQATLILNVLASSRASPLPHWMFIVLSGV